MEACVPQGPPEASSGDNGGASTAPPVALALRCQFECADTDVRVIRTFCIYC